MISFHSELIQTSRTFCSTGLASFALCFVSVIRLQMPPHNGGVWYEVSWLAASARSQARPNDNLHTPSVSESKHQMSFIYTADCPLHREATFSRITHDGVTRPFFKVKSAATLHVLCLRRWRHCLFSIATIKMDSTIQMLRAGDSSKEQKLCRIVLTSSWDQQQGRHIHFLNIGVFSNMGTFEPADF